MKKLLAFYIVLIILILGCIDSVNVTEKSIFLSSEDVKLVAPSIRQLTTFFSDSANVEFSRIHEKANIYYKLDMDTFKVYKNPFTITGHTSISYYATGGGFLNSDTISEFLFDNGEFESFEIKGSMPKSPYFNNGLSALTDRVKASKNFKDENWIAYSDSIISYQIGLDNIQSYNSLYFSLLQVQSAWIFLPYRIELLNKDSLGGTLDSYSKMLNYSADPDKDGFKFIKFDISQWEIQNLHINLIPLKAIPDWHPGEGNTPWTFIDEIFII